MQFIDLNLKITEDLAKRLDRIGTTEPSYGRPAQSREEVAVAGLNHHAKDREGIEHKRTHPPRYVVRWGRRVKV